MLGFVCAGALVALWLVRYLLQFRLVGVESRATAPGALAATMILGKQVLMVAAVLAVVRSASPTVLAWVGLLGVGVGVAVRTVALGCLGGCYSLGTAPAGTGHLETSGLYGFVRHPLAVGYGVEALGLGCVAGGVLGWGLVALVLVLAHRLVCSEERALIARFGAKYITYMSCVPRYLPLRVGTRIDEGAAGGVTCRTRPAVDKNAIL